MERLRATFERTSDSACLAPAIPGRGRPTRLCPRLSPKHSSPPLARPLSALPATGGGRWLVSPRVNHRSYPLRRRGSRSRQGSRHWLCCTDAALAISGLGMHLPPRGRGAGRVRYPTLPHSFANARSHSQWESPSMLPWMALEVIASRRWLRKHRRDPAIERTNYWCRCLHT
jgi:hypothetical protein